jgi:uncharacterized protein
MKKILILSALVMSLTACATAQNTNEETPKLGMPNPASKFCIDQGGKLDIKNEANGQVGYCQLPDGKVIEEWEFFRSSLKECNAEEAQKLIGQKNLDVDAIQKQTNTSTVRIVQPNQPVTMDYRSDRITIVVDPVSKKVTHSTCG